MRGQQKIVVSSVLLLASNGYCFTLSPVTFSARLLLDQQITQNVPSTDSSIKPKRPDDIHNDTNDVPKMILPHTPGMAGLTTNVMMSVKLTTPTGLISLSTTKSL